MTAIPDDIAQVAAVVLGEQRTNLTGWQRDDAIHAMTALGYSRHHIAWSLTIDLTALKEYCRKRRIHTHHTDQHIDWVAVDMVVTGTARLPLTGADRIAAIRAMNPRLTDVEIAHRLMIPHAKHLIAIAGRAGITLRRPDRWSWQEYLHTGNGTNRGRHRREVAA